MSVPGRGRRVVHPAVSKGFTAGVRSSGKAWMITFSDMISLMLTFFVLLFSMADLGIDKWDKITDTMSRALKPTIVEEEIVLTAAAFNISTVLQENATDLDYLSGVMTELLSKNEVLRDSRVIRLDDRLVIALPSDALFEGSGAVLTERARQAAFSLSGVLRNVDNQIRVNGHSDSGQPDLKRFDSNWELSIIRAAVVGNFLRQSGVEQEIAAFGFSDSRYSELSDLSEEERAVMARRIDIVVFPTSGEL